MPVPDTDVRQSRRFMAERAVDTVREAILEGTLLPGEELPDGAMSDWLGVSRATLRRAYTELEAAALVEVPPHRSVRVAAPDEHAADQAFQTLGFVTRGAIVLAIARDDSAALDRVAHGMDRGLAAARAQDAVSLNRAGRLGLTAIAEASGNRTLADLTRTALDGMWFHLRARQIGATPYDWVALTDTIRLLREAVVLRDVAAAASATERFHGIATLAPVTSPAPR